MLSTIVTTAKAESEDDPQKKKKTQTVAEVLPKIPNPNSKLTATSYGWYPYL